MVVRGPRGEGIHRNESPSQGVHHSVSAAAALLSMAGHGEEQWDS